MKKSAFLMVSVFVTAALAGPKEEVSKPLKTVVNSVRYGRFAAALKLFAGEAQGQALLGDAWNQAKPEEQKEFVELFHTLFGKIAFPKIQKNFEHLDTVLFDEPKLSGAQASINATILINHPLKKQELKVAYALAKQGKTWAVVDASVGGESMLTGIRDDQLKPLLKEGGISAVLKAMREKAKELEGTRLQ